MSPSDAPETTRRALVLVDTNGWFLPERAGIDLARAVDAAVGPAEVAAPAVALAELRRLVDRNAPGASVALALARRVRRVASTGRGDAGLLETAIRRGAWVLTGDRGLELRLLGAGVPVLSPRRGGGLRAVRPGGGRRPASTVKKRPPVAGWRPGDRRRP